MRPVDHHLAEQRSLALHRLIADRLRADPSLQQQALNRVRSWLESNASSIEYALRWLSLLQGSLDSLVSVLCSDSEEARALRQATPFAFVVGPRERWQLWQDVRERWEKSGDSKGA